MLPRRALVPLSVLAAACGGNSPNVTSSSSSGSGGGVDVGPYVTAPTSCAYDCPADACPEAQKPYECPAMGAWAKIPHTGACGGWDGKYPAATPGQCTASAPAGSALKRT